MRYFAYRFHSGQLLKEEIQKIVVRHNIEAGIVLSLVGAVENAVLRLAGSTSDNQIIKQWDEPMEIVSATGTVSKNGCHIHISLSNKDGLVVGGHLKDGCKIWPTAEIVIGILDDIEFTRVIDDSTGFKELQITNKQ